MIAFHNYAMINQYIYKTILASKTGMDYIPVIFFENNLINVNESKTPTKSNQLEKYKEKIGVGAAPSRTYGLPENISLWEFLFGGPKCWSCR